MTPTEVRELSAAEFVAFKQAMDDYRKAQEREARKAAARGKRR